MDAVSVIKNNMDVERILNHYNIQYKYFGDIIRCACPIHGGDNPTAFVVNDKFLWFCHTGDCGKGDVFHFVQEMDEIEFPQAVKKVAEILGIDIENLAIAERKSEYMKEMDKFLSYIKSKKTSRREYIEYVPRAELKPVKKFRNFDEKTLEHFELQYAKEIVLEKKSGGDFTLYERLVIPIKLCNVTIGCSLRKIRANDTPKWFHVPHIMETGDLLYNFDACKNYREVIVCEGMFDVWRWHEAGYENTVCTFGAHLTDIQYKLLLRSGKDIIWSFDGDETGANATKKAVDMFRWKAKQWIVKFPDGVDPGSCTSEELQKLFEEKEKVI